jgi:hypothetical protein
MFSGSSAALGTRDILATARRIMLENSDGVQHQNYTELEWDERWSLYFSQSHES